LWAVGGCRLSEALAVADKAAELLAARDGTMTAEELVDRAPSLAVALDPHVAAQGAEVALLQARAAELEAENASLRAELEALTEDRRHTTADALRAKVRSLQNDLARLTANPPTSLERAGQLAEDEIRVRGALCGCSEATCAEPEDHAALSRLAARAQQGQAATKALEAIRERLAKAPKHFPSAACDAAIWVVDGDDAKGPAP
jgi:hypothetical protein